MFIKFIFNLEWFSEFLNQDDYLYWAGMFKLGIVEYDNLFRLLKYMLPEVMILMFIMLNEIHLKLTGLFYEIETDVESVVDGI